MKRLDMDFNSPQGRLAAAQQAQRAQNAGKVVNTSQMKKKVLTIPDAEEEELQTSFEAKSSVWEDFENDEFELRKNVNAVRKKSQETKQQINPLSKEKIEILIGLKRKTDSIIIDDVKFTLQTLSRKQNKLALSNTYKSFQLQERTDISQTEFGLELQAQQLAVSLVAVNDEDVFSWFETEDPLDVAAYFDEFSDEVMDTLYEFYKKLKLSLPPVEPEQFTDDLKK